MNGQLNGQQILPDQMQVANPILILALIPTFDYVLYPLLGWLNNAGNKYQLSPHPREVRYPEDSAAEDCHWLFPLWSRLRGFRHSGAGAEEGISRAAQGWRGNNSMIYLDLRGNNNSLLRQNSSSTMV